MCIRQLTYSEALPSTCGAGGDVWSPFETSGYTLSMSNPWKHFRVFLELASMCVRRLEPSEALPSTSGAGEDVYWLFGILGVHALYLEPLEALPSILELVRRCIRRLEHSEVLPSILELARRCVRRLEPAEVLPSNSGVGERECSIFGTLGSASKCFSNTCIAETRGSASKGSWNLIRGRRNYQNHVEALPRDSWNQKPVVFY